MHLEISYTQDLFCSAQGHSLFFTKRFFLFSINQRPSTLEGFTQPVSNDRGHILPGIPRSSKSPWGEFIGTWDMKKPPLRTKTMKTNVMTSSIQNTAPVPEESNRTPSPRQEGAIGKARTPTPQQEAGRTLSPRDGVVQEKTSWRPQSQEVQCKRSPSPSKQKTPEPPASPGQGSAPKKHVVLDEPS